MTTYKIKWKNKDDPNNGTHVMNMRGSDKQDVINKLRDKYPQIPFDENSEIVTVNELQ